MRNRRYIYIYKMYIYMLIIHTCILYSCYEYTYIYIYIYIVSYIYMMILMLYFDAHISNSLYPKRNIPMTESPHPTPCDAGAPPPSPAFIILCISHSLVVYFLGFDQLAMRHWIRTDWLLPSEFIFFRIERFGFFVATTYSILTILTKHWLALLFSKRHVICQKRECMPPHAQP